MTSCCVCNGPMHNECPHLDLNPVGDFVRVTCVPCAERVVQSAFETWGWQRTVSLASDHVCREEVRRMFDVTEKKLVTILPTGKIAGTSTSTPARTYTNDNAEDQPPPMLE